MNSVFSFSKSITRHLVRGVLVALLLTQFAWADHFHLDIEQNAGCSVCAFADNSPAVPATNALVLSSEAQLDYQWFQDGENPLSPPSFNHHSRAPPVH